MKAVWLFVISAALLLFGVWLLFNQFHGSMNINAGWPLSACKFQMSGMAQGGGVAAALVLLLLSAVLFISALISTINMSMRPPAPPSTPTSKETWS